MFLSVQVTRRARVRVTRHSIPNMVILAMCGGQKTTTNLQIVTAYHSKLGSSTANSMADWLAGCMGFNGTFGTNRLQHAKENIKQYE